MNTMTFVMFSNNHQIFVFCLFGFGEKALPFRQNHVISQKLLRNNLPSKHSPDSSGSPLLGVGNGDAAATADSGTHLDTRTCHRLQKIIKAEL